MWRMCPHVICALKSKKAAVFTINTIYSSNKYENTTLKIYGGHPMLDSEVKEYS